MHFQENIHSGLLEKINHKSTRHNSTYPKVAVQWLNQALCSYQSLCLVDSEVLRNPLLRQASNPYAHPMCDTTDNKRTEEWKTEC
jgi:hypothetical protein